MTDDIIAAIKTVYDPEIPADIYELGLIYKVDIEDDRSVKVEMTLTTPNCPSAAELPIMVETAVASVPGVSGAKVDIVWDPPWDPSRMSDEARLVLNMCGFIISQVRGDGIFTADHYLTADARSARR
jgi:FeS assembly SUF system protein